MQSLSEQTSQAIALINAVATILTPLGVIITALLAYAGLRQGRRTHSEVNGRMTQLIDQQKQISEAVGEKRERDVGAREHAAADKPEGGSGLLS
jgi:hypothetical protein